MSKDSPLETLETSPDDPGYSSSEYSPMHGTLVVSDSVERGEMGETSVPLLAPGSDQDDGEYYNSEEMGSFESESAVGPGSSYLQSSSYVPPGYMVVEAGGGGGGAEYDRFQQFSVSSL